MQRINGLWYDVTQEILGSASPAGTWPTRTPARREPMEQSGPTTCPEINPNAVIRLQRVRDVPFHRPACRRRHRLNKACGYEAGVVGNVSARTDYWPNALYDPREGNVRDGIAGGPMWLLGGIMNYVELDVNNLRRWIAGQIGTTGSSRSNENGYIVYFSDRRNNRSNVAATVRRRSRCPARPASTAGRTSSIRTIADRAAAEQRARRRGRPNGTAVLDVYGRLARERAGSARRRRSTRTATAVHVHHRRAANRVRARSRAPTGSSISAAR